MIMMKMVCLEGQKVAPSLHNFRFYTVLAIETATLFFKGGHDLFSIIISLWSCNYYDYDHVVSYHDLVVLTQETISHSKLFNAKCQGKSQASCAANMWRDVSCNHSEGHEITHNQGKSQVLYIQSTRINSRSLCTILLFLWYVRYKAEGVGMTFSILLCHGQHRRISFFSTYCRKKTDVIINQLTFVFFAPKRI